jgi:hypothetical protein
MFFDRDRALASWLKTEFLNDTLAVHSVSGFFGVNFPVHCGHADSHGRSFSASLSLQSPYAFAIMSAIQRKKLTAFMKNGGQ